MKVTILEKESKPWTGIELLALRNAKVDIEGLPSKPNRIVALNKPKGGSTFEEILNSDFTTREVEYSERWK